MSHLLDDSMVNALEVGGTFTFVIEVQSALENGPLGTVKVKDALWRDDIVELERGEIIHEEAQKELADYLRQHKCIKILLNGCEVWKRKPEKVILISEDNFYHDTL